MIDQKIRIYLPAFMLIATGVIFFWKYFRKSIRLRARSHNPEKILEYNRLKRISGYYWIVFYIFLIMILTYSLIPNFYYVFIPLQQFDKPFLNEIGLMIIKISLIWIVMAQIGIDKELYKYSRDIESLSAMEMVRYSEKTLLTGILLLFIGVFSTITNIVGLLLIVICLVLYNKVINY